MSAASVRNWELIQELAVGPCGLCWAMHGLNCVRRSGGNSVVPPPGKGEAGKCKRRVKGEPVDLSNGLQQGGESSERQQQFKVFCYHRAHCTNQNQAGCRC